VPRVLEKIAPPDETSPRGDQDISHRAVVEKWPAERGKRKNKSVMKPKVGLGKKKKTEENRVVTRRGWGWMSGGIMPL